MIIKTQAWRATIAGIILWFMAARFVHYAADWMDPACMLPILYGVAILTSIATVWLFALLGKARQAPTDSHARAGHRRSAGQYGASLIMRGADLTFLSVFLWPVKRA